MKKHTYTKNRITKKHQCNGFYLVVLVALIIGVCSTQVWAQAAREAVKIKQFSLLECLEMSGIHYQPMHIAETEIRVAESKALEAARNLWPTLSTKGEITHGAAIQELGTPGFREQSYGLQLNYTLFNGGQLWSTYQQADFQLQVSHLKYKKQFQEMIYQVAEAYWNLARIRDDVHDYKRSLKKVGRYHKMARQLYQQGIINKRILLATTANKNQVTYLLESAGAEEEKYYWEWLEALGVQTPIQGQVQSLAPSQPEDITLSSCISMAHEHHPELAIQGYLHKISELEQTIKHSGDWPKIELSGFYGRSGGAYNSEDLHLREDYNVNIKLTQQIAWNTISTSGFEQKTSPKLGQSSRTESRTVSAAINWLDGYKSAREKKEVELGVLQADYNQHKTLIKVEQQVREAYFNYKKAVSQIKHAETELDLYKRELAIHEINLRDKKATLSDMAEAQNKLIGSKAAWREALAFYYISLAALDKAIGIPGKFSGIDVQKISKGKGGLL